MAEFSFFFENCILDLGYEDMKWFLSLGLRFGGAKIIVVEVMLVDNDFASEKGSPIDSCGEN